MKNNKMNMNKKSKFDELSEMNEINVKDEVFDMKNKYEKVFELVSSEKSDDEFISEIVDKARQPQVVTASTTIKMKWVYAGAAALIAVVGIGAFAITQLGGNGGIVSPNTSHDVDVENELADAGGFAETVVIEKVKEFGVDKDGNVLYEVEATDADGNFVVPGNDNLSDNPYSFVVESNTFDDLRVDLVSIKDGGFGAKAVTLRFWVDGETFGSVEAFENRFPMLRCNFEFDDYADSAEFDSGMLMPSKADFYVVNGEAYREFWLVPLSASFVRFAPVIRFKCRVAQDIEPPYYGDAEIEGDAFEGLMEFSFLSESFEAESPYVRYYSKEGRGIEFNDAARSFVEGTYLSDKAYLSAVMQGDYITLGVNVGTENPVDELLVSLELGDGSVSPSGTDTFYSIRRNETFADFSISGVDKVTRVCGWYNEEVGYYCIVIFREFPIVDDTEPIANVVTINGIRYDLMK